MTAALYRLDFEDGGVYFGVAANFAARLLRHECLARLYVGRVNFSGRISKEFATLAEAYEAEKTAIRAARDLGLPLRNAADGGKGGGGKHSLQTRQKIAAAKRGKRAPNLQLSRADDKYLFVLRYVSRWTAAELAAEFGVSQKCIYDHLRRAAA